MHIITGIDPKALQLTIILLRQYHPKLAKLLPGPKNYPLPGVEINLELDAEEITQIIEALNDIGERWLNEKAASRASRDKGKQDRDRYRQTCLGFILEEWIQACEQCQHQIKAQLH